MKIEIDIGIRKLTLVFIVITLLSSMIVNARLDMDTDSVDYTDGSDFIISSDGNISLQSTYDLNITNDVNISGNLNITGHIFPVINNTYDLGNESLRWRDLYVAGNLTVTGNITNDAIYAQLSDSTDQTFAATGTGQAITFNTNDEINGITHSTVSETENITIITAGVYSIIAQPQVTAGAGDAGYFHMWLRKNTGSGFVDIPNSNVELTLGSLDEDVIPLIVTISLDVGDVIRVNASVGNTGIKLDAQTPANEPAIPSIIFSIYRVGT
jgi:hypothetical protein